MKTPDSDYEQAVLRMETADGSNELRGTAFAIGPRHFLTCSHLFSEGCDLVAYQSLQRGRIAKFEVHSHSELDVALCELSDGTSSFNKWIQPALQPLAADIDGEVCAVGYPVDINNGLSRWCGQVSAVNDLNGWIALQGSSMPGVSGGPVVYKGRAIGVLIGRHLSGAQIYAIPYALVHSWCEAWGYRLPPLKTPTTELSQVPIGPLVQARAIPQALFEAFALKFATPTTASRHVNASMSNLLTEVGAASIDEKRDVITPADLPASAANMNDYWFNVLSSAGVKSRRTLAAIIFTDNAIIEDDFDTSNRRVFQNFLDELKNPK